MNRDANMRQGLFIKNPGTARSIIENLLQPVDVHINGTRPWDIRVHDERFFKTVVRHWSLGLGESYMDEWWDCDALDELFCRALSGGLESALWTWHLFLGFVRAALINLQRASRAFVPARHHYDLGNDLYRAMLDKRLVYTCAYWKEARNLDEAQEHKLDLVCRKIGLQPGMHVLDIGCGWGSFLKYAAENYGVKGVGVTVSKAQVELAQELCAGLPIQIQLQDYRDITGQYDRVVSLGMIEHVGYRNYRRCMEGVARSLREGGLFLLQTIGTPHSTTYTDPWIDKYIFPDSMLPSLKQLAAAAEGLFVVEDLHSFGNDYDRTLMAWHANFEANWHSLKQVYGDRFHRMWRYYLLSCAGSFRARDSQLWQIVFSRKGVPGGYHSLR